MISAIPTDHDVCCQSCCGIIALATRVLRGHTFNPSKCALLRMQLHVVYFFNDLSYKSPVTDLSYKSPVFLFPFDKYEFMIIM